jgi:ribosomal protein L10
MSMENAGHPTKQFKQFIKSNSREIIQIICRRLENPKCTITKKKKRNPERFFL